MKSKTDEAEKCVNVNSVVLICQLAVEILRQIKTSSQKWQLVYEEEHWVGTNGVGEKVQSGLVFLLFGDNYTKKNQKNKNQKTTSWSGYKLNLFS